MAHIVQETLTRAGLAGIPSDLVEKFHTGVIQASLDTEEHGNLSRLSRELEAWMEIQHEQPELKLIAHPAFDRLLIHKVCGFYGLDSRPGERGTHEVFVRCPEGFSYSGDVQTQKREDMKRLLELSGKALQDPSFPPASSRPMKKSKQQKAALEKEAAAAAAAAAGVDDPNQILMNLSKFGARGGRQGAASAYGGYPAGLVPSQLHHPGMLAFPYSQAYAPQAYAPAGYIPMAAAQPYVQTTPGLLGMIPQTGAYVDPSMLTAGLSYGYMGGAGAAGGHNQSPYVQAQPAAYAPSYMPAPPSHSAQGQGYQQAHGGFGLAGAHDHLGPAPADHVGSVNLMSPALMNLLQQQQQPQ